jgi:hypothetical protein
VWTATVWGPTCYKGRDQQKTVRDVACSGPAPIPSMIRRGGATIQWRGWDADGV